MFLTTLHQYAGKDGKIHPKRKTLAKGLNWSVRAVDNSIHFLKKNLLLDTESTGSHSSSEYILLYHEIYESIEIKKPSTSTQTKILPESIELLEYWNNKRYLTTHNINLENPSGVIRNVNAGINKLLDGTYYTDHEGVHVGAKNILFTVEKIKKAIDRMDIASSPDYWKNSGQGKMTFEKFIFNPRAKLGKGRSRYRYKYALLHFFSNMPKPLSDTHTKKKGKYNGLVDRLIKKLTGLKPENMGGTDYNKVVKYVEKAVVIIEKCEPTIDSKSALIRRIPDLIYDSMIECGKEDKNAMDIERLGLAVHNLKEMMQKRRIIR